MNAKQQSHFSCLSSLEQEDWDKKMKATRHDIFGEDMMRVRIFGVSAPTGCIGCCCSDQALRNRRRHGGHSIGTEGNEGNEDLIVLPSCRCPSCFVSFVAFCSNGPG